LQSPRLPAPNMTPQKLTLAFEDGSDMTLQVVSPPIYSEDPFHWQVFQCRSQWCAGGFDFFVIFLLHLLRRHNGGLRTDSRLRQE
jgi:hypothetical protein